MITTPYFNWGRWVADCPNPDCRNAMEVQPGQTQFRCGDRPGIIDTCGIVADLDWPAEANTVASALASEPGHKQSWQPGMSVP